MSWKYPNTATGDDMLLDIHFQVQKLEHLGFDEFCRSSGHGLDPGIELIQGKRLDHVVIGALFEGGNLGGDIARNRQEENRGIFAGRPNFLADGQAVFLGQGVIEYDSIIVETSGQE